MPLRPHLGVVTHYVVAARAEEDFEAVTAVGIDETAARRGHAYITLVHDLEARRLLFACEGRDQDTVASFVADLEAHERDQSEHLEGRVQFRLVIGGRGGERQA